MLGLRALARLFRRRPARPVIPSRLLAKVLPLAPAKVIPLAPAEVIPPALAETMSLALSDVIPLALAEKAMADGCPTPDQELMLMAAGSPAHLARRHPSLVRPQWRNH